MVEALPTVVVYTIRPFDLWLARKFIKSRYISLVNLLADAEVMPEYLTDHDVSGELSRWALLWLNDPDARAQASAELAALRDRVAVPGASERAADRIVEVVCNASGRTTYPGRHRHPTASFSSNGKGGNGERSRRR
jgi:lipid-A-disaccharide synthase